MVVVGVMVVPDTDTLADNVWVYARTSRKLASFVIVRGHVIELGADVLTPFHPIGHLSFYDN